MRINGIRVFSLVKDYKYDPEGNMQIIKAGTDFYGGVASCYPSLREYSTTWGNRRYYFCAVFVENAPSLFKELYT